MSSVLDWGLLVLLCALYRPPDLFRCQWHVDLRHAERSEGVERRVDECGWRAGRAGLADALCAVWSERAGRFRVVQFEVRDWSACGTA